MQQFCMVGIGGLVKAIDKISSETKIKLDSTWTTENILLARPFSNILKIVNSPAATSQCGRTCQLSDSDFKAICKLLEWNINNHTED